MNTNTNENQRTRRHFDNSQYKVSHNEVSVEQTTKCITFESQSAKPTLILSKKHNFFMFFALKSLFLTLSQDSGTPGAQGPQMAIQALNQLIQRLPNPRSAPLQADLQGNRKFPLFDKI